MKTLILIITMLTVCSSYGQGGNYTQTMQAVIQDLYAAETSNDYDPVINKLKRIADVEKDQWEPNYYIALGYTFKAGNIENNEEKDALLDEGLQFVSKAAEITENNAEILALEGFINMIKVSVDPGTRGQTLSPKVMATFGKALGIEPDNPRANLFMAQMQIGTARFFGTGIEEPCAMVSKSVELFDNYQPKSALSPMWGKRSAERYVRYCDEQLNSQKE